MLLTVEEMKICFDSFVENIVVSAVAAEDSTLETRTSWVFSVLAEVLVVLEVLVVYLSSLPLLSGA